MRRNTRDILEVLVNNTEENIDTLTFKRMKNLNKGNVFLHN